MSTNADTQAAPLMPPTSVLSSGGNAAESIGITVDIEPDKPVDIDISKLIADVAQTPPPKVEPPKDDEVVIDVAEQVSPPPVTPPGPDPVVELRTQLAAMEARAESERRAREYAEQDASRSRAEVEQSRVNLQHTQLQAISNAIAAEQADADALERGYAQALRAGDHATAAKCQRAMARIESRLVQLEDGKVNLEQAIRSPQPAQERRQPRPQDQPQRDARPAPAATSSDPVEAYLQTRTPRVQAFLKSRDRSWLTDKRMNDKLVAAHHLAKSENYVEDTDAYFEYIDQQMGVKKAAPAPAALAQRVPAKKTIPAAPTSRAASSNQSGVSGTTVHLTPRQRDAARALGMTEAAYAERVWRMSQPNWEGPRFD